MKLSKKTQISIIEIPLLLLLFISFLFIPGILHQSETKDYKLSIDSFFDSIIYSEDYRDIFMDENLSKLSITEDYSNLKIVLDKVFIHYDLSISNLTVEKKIFSCEPIFNKYVSERIISIKNNDNFEFRKIILGVCY